MCTRFTCFKTCNAVTSGIRFCGMISIFSVPSAVHPFVRKRFPHYRISSETTGFFETCLRRFPRSLVVSIQKWFDPVDKFGRRQPSLIFTFIASPPEQLEEFCQNLAYEFFSMSRCVRPKMILVCQKNLINRFIALSCQEFGYTILFMTKNIRMSTRHEFISIIICLLKVLSFQKVSLLFL